jgi:tagatose 6-phosphate kinase
MTFAKLQIDAVNRASAVHEYASGKSINAARVAHTLGEPVLATGFLGGDRGRFIRAGLDRAGVAHDFVEVEPATRMCITVIDESMHTATELLEESQPVSRESYDGLLEKLAALVSRARVVVMSGRLTVGADPDFYARIHALATNARCIVDVTGPPLLATLDKRPFLVKPNRAELTETLEAEIDDAESLRGAMRETIARGARWVVVTAGTEPTLVTDGKRFWQIDVPKVRPVSPIGSGDAFCAGIAVGISRGMDVPEACRLGTACAVANAMTPYAGHVDRAEIERQLSIVKLSPV